MGNSLGRRLTLMATLIAVTAGFGRGLVWLSENVSTLAVAGCGFVLWCAVLFLVIEGIQGLTWRGLGRVILIGILGTAAAEEFVMWAEPYPLAMYAFTAAGAIPTLWLLDRQDKRAHKKCPDCCETVKAEARVCRYCRHKFSTLNPD
jgi:hypothetical protein